MCRSVTLGMDGVTNVLAKSMSNVILHMPLLFFLNIYEPMLSLKWPSTSSPSLKTWSSSLMMKISALANWAYLVIFGPPCNAMRCLRSKLEDKGFCVVEYGCSVCSFNNLCQDISLPSRLRSALRKLFWWLRPSRLSGWFERSFESQVRQGMILFYAFACMRRRTVLWRQCQLMKEDVLLLYA